MKFSLSTATSTALMTLALITLAVIESLNDTVLAVPQLKAVDQALTVVPGQRIGKVYLGFTPRQVHKLLGKPDKSLQLRGGLNDDLYLAKKTRIDRNETTTRDKIEVLYRQNKVVQIEVTTPTFRTAAGLSTGSTVGQLTSSKTSWRVLVYGYYHPDSSWQNFYFVNQKSGLTIEFQGWQEQLMRRSYPTTIIIHKPGSRVIPDIGGKLVTDSTDLSVVMSQYD